MVHEQTANTKPLGLLVNGDLPKEQRRNITMMWCPSWWPGQFRNIHRADSNRVIAENPCLSRFDRDLDPGHIRFLLFFRR